MTTLPRLRRRGISLVETLVLMSVMSVVLTLSTSLIHASLHRHRQSQRALTIERDAWRLSHQLRRDVASATTFRLNTDSEPEGVSPRSTATLTLTLPRDAQLEYRWQSERVVRIERRPNDPPRCEEFTWGENGVATVTQLDSPRRLVVSLRPKESEELELPLSPITNQRLPPALLELEIPLPAEAP